MRSFIKKLIIGLLPRSIIRAVQISFPTENIYFSQDGEDIILTRYFELKKNGFYVDIGAHHPIRFSNTYLFYQRGWSGINVDAMPGSMRAFNTLRPRDINLEIAVASKKQILRYYIFNEQALNTFSEKEALSKDGLGNFKIVQTIELETQPLSIILDRYLPKNQTIDIMTIDVEGLDFDVIKSNDWTKYSPKMILIELLEMPLENILTDKAYVYLKQLGYSIVAKTCNTLFLKNDLWN